MPANTSYLWTFSFLLSALYSSFVTAQGSYTLNQPAEDEDSLLRAQSAPSRCYSLISQANPLFLIGKTENSAHRRCFSF